MAIQYAKANNKTRIGAYIIKLGDQFLCELTPMRSV